MKTILTALTLFLSILASAQYYPFPTDSAVWVNYAESYTNEPNPLPNWETWYVDNFCATGADTVINAIDYKVIELCHANGGDYFGAIRYDSGRVYFVPIDSLSEGLLYDFTLNPGESADVLIKYPGEAAFAAFSTHTVTVSNVDTIIVNGSERRQLNFGGSYSWVEGVGSTAGLFAEIWDNVSMYYIYLACQSVHDTTEFEDGFPLVSGYPGSCPLTLSIDELLAQDDWNIYPNPASDFIRITSDALEQQKVTIYDAFGRMVLDGYSTEEEILIATLENGIYYAEVAQAVRMKFLVSK